MSDYELHCVKRITEDSEGNYITSSFIGQCSVPGSKDGTGDGALLSFPSAIVADPTNADILWILDGSSSPLKQVTISTKVVATMGGLSNQAFGTSDPTHFSMVYYKSALFITSSSMEVIVKVVVPEPKVHSVTFGTSLGSSTSGISQSSTASQ